MIFLTNFVHAWFFCIAPLSFLKHKVSYKKQIIFIIIYGLSVYLSRYIYIVFPIPFGTHTIVLIIIAVFLFRFICHVSYKISILMVIVTFIVLIAGDALIVLPVMNHLNITTTSVDENIVHRVIGLGLSNISLLIMYAMGRTIKYKKKHHNVLIGSDKH